MSAVTDATPPASSRRSTALMREVGLIGLIWASVGSIIGSGWLFGAQKGLIAAGPAAIISWIIGGVHDHGARPDPRRARRHVPGLRRHRPLPALRVRRRRRRVVRLVLVAAGRDRRADRGVGDDHLRPALLASRTAGSTRRRRAHHHRPDRRRDPDGAPDRDQLPRASRCSPPPTAPPTWWKIAVPLLDHPRAGLRELPPSNFTAANGFNPDGLNGILAAVSTGGIIFSYLGFEQADQLAGEAKNPQAGHPVRDHRLDRASA